MITGKHRTITEDQLENMSWAIQFITYLNTLSVTLTNAMKDLPDNVENIKQEDLNYNKTLVDKHSIVQEIKDKFISMYENRNTVDSGWSTLDIEESVKRFLHKIPEEELDKYRYDKSTLISIARYIEYNFNTADGITESVIDEAVSSYFSKPRLEIDSYYNVCVSDVEED